MRSFRDIFGRLFGRNKANQDADVYERGKVHAISKPTRAPWDATITYVDLKKLIEGYIPSDMDDKWMCQTHGPDAKGVYMVNISRSWTRLTIVAIRIWAELDEHQRPVPGHRGKVKEIIWESDKTNYDDESATVVTMKELARDICWGRMEVEFHEE